jgi:hypothetical protein
VRGASSVTEFGAQQGVKHGVGTLRYRDGGQYRGCFVNDLAEGRGEVRARAGRPGCRRRHGRV